MSIHECGERNVQSEEMSSDPVVPIWSLVNENSDDANGDCGLNL